MGGACAPPLVHVGPGMFLQLRTVGLAVGRVASMWGSFALRPTLRAPLARCPLSACVRQTLLEDNPQFAQSGLVVIAGEHADAANQVRAQEDRVDRSQHGG